MHKPETPSMPLSSKILVFDSLRSAASVGGSVHILCRTLLLNSREVLEGVLGVGFDSLATLRPVDRADLAMLVLHSYGQLGNTNAVILGCSTDGKLEGFDKTESLLD